MMASPSARIPQRSNSARAGLPHHDEDNPASPDCGARRSAAGQQLVESPRWSTHFDGAEALPQSTLLRSDSAAHKWDALTVRAHKGDVAVAAANGAPGGGVEEEEKEGPADRIQSFQI